MTEEPPQGRRYSLTYLPVGQLLPDSKRLRARLGSRLGDVLHETKLDAEVATAIRTELGVDVPSNYVYNFRRFIEECAIRDVLDTITLAYRVLSNPGVQYSEGPTYAGPWLEFVRRAMAEENVGYHIDSQGGVHPLVDVEFESQRVALIQTLAGARYKATREAFDGAHEALERSPPDTKEAVRDVFGALENLFKLMTGGLASRLAKFEIEKHLPPILDRHYNEAVARTAAARVMDSLVDWVAAGHNYRHEPGTPDPVPPPMDYAVVTMSTGAGFLRWLAEIDRALNPKT